MLFNMKLSSFMIFITFAFGGDACSKVDLEQASSEGTFISLVRIALKDDGRPVSQYLVEGLPVEDRVDMLFSGDSDRVRELWLEEQSLIEVVE